MRRKTRVLAPAFIVVSASLGLSCGGPSPVQPPVEITPTPTPQPDPSPRALSCPLGKGSIDATCSAAAPELRDAVLKAIDALLLHRPELFNTREENVGGSRQYRVIDVDGYLNGLVDELRAAGLCAERTLDLERLLVKRENQLSEEWDVMTSNRYIRRDTRSYKTSCRPAAFPLDPVDYIAYVRTHLWHYECFTPGVVPPTPGDRKIPVGCDGRVTATPKQKNGRDVPARIHGPLVAWEQRSGFDIVKLETDPRFPDEPFNKVAVTSGKLGWFQVCATVLGKTGCLDAQVIAPR